MDEAIEERGWGFGKCIITPSTLTIIPRREENISKSKYGTTRCAVFLSFNAIKAQGRNLELGRHDAPSCCCCLEATGINDKSRMIDSREINDSTSVLVEVKRQKKGLGLDIKRVFT